jgi:hypothetical protein
VKWTAPYNGGSSITSYTVEFQHKFDPSTFTQIAFYCDGTTPFVLSYRQCTIPMTLFRQAPFLLEFKDLIISRVKATNLIGTGPYSDLNTNGVKIMTEPEAPLNAPVITSYDEYSI